MFSWQWFKAASVTVLIFLVLVINANGKHHFVYKQTYPNNQKRNKFPTYLPVFCWPFPQHGEYVIRESVIS